MTAHTAEGSRPSAGSGEGRRPAATPRADQQMPRPKVTDTIPSVSDESMMTSTPTQPRAASVRPTVVGAPGRAAPGRVRRESLR